MKIAGVQCFGLIRKMSSTYSWPIDLWFLITNLSGRNLSENLVMSIAVADQEFYRVWTTKLSQNVTSFLRIISHFLQIISHFLRIYLNPWQNLQEMCFLRNLPKYPQEKLKFLVMAGLATRKVGAEPGQASAQASWGWLRPCPQEYGGTYILSR